MAFDVEYNILNSILSLLYICITCKEIMGPDSFVSIFPINYSF